MTTVFSPEAAYAFMAIAHLAFTATLVILWRAQPEERALALWALATLSSAVRYALTVWPGNGAAWAGHATDVLIVASMVLLLPGAVLFLGRRHGAYVNGCTLEESEALLNELWTHCTQPRFCYEHRWSAGDVVVWDNRATLHRRDAFESTSRRVLYAAQVEGHRPFEAPDALTRPAHPRARLWTA